MLQQTTVPAVMPYFAKFLARWPDVHDLAAAPVDEVMEAWAGLGYYARARNLHKCAQAVSERPGGIFPDTVDGLLELPGTGAYTAAAIAGIAFARPAAVLARTVRGDGGLGRAWLLRPRAQPAQMRAGSERTARWHIPGYGRRPAGTARYRRLYGRRHRSDCLRSPGRRAGRQCRAGAGAAVRSGNAIAAGQTGIAPAGRTGDARQTPRRFRAGHDGSRRHGVHAAQSRLPALPEIGRAHV